NVIHPEDRISTVLNWKETLKNQNNQEAEYRLRMANGSYRWHVSRAIAIKDENQKIARWVGTTTDIEEQKMARDEGLQEKKKMYSLFMQAPVAICVLSGPEHTFELVNDPAKESLGGLDVTGLPVKMALPDLVAQGFLNVLDEVYHSGKGKLYPSKFVSYKRKD